jgi:hypothetical protein
MPYSIITGDFNARVGSYQQCLPNYSGVRNNKDTVVNEKGRELMRCLEENEFYVLNGSSASDPEGEYTFCTKNGSSSIDLSICSSDIFSKTDFCVLDEVQTSHFPILTKIEGPLQIAHAVDYTKMIWNADKADSFRYSLDFLLKYNDSNNNVESFTKSIIRAAEDNGMTITRTLESRSVYHGPRWFDKSCRVCKTNTRRKLRQYRKCEDVIAKPIYKMEYLTAQRYYVNYIRAKKRKFYCSLEYKLCESRNPKEFYSALSFYRPKHSNESVKEHVSPENFRQSYSQLFSSTEIDAVNIEPIIEDEDLDYEFDFSELNFAIKNLSKGKAAGGDSVINELWINLSSTQRLMLLDCINKCWRDNEIPVSWSEIVMAPIYKKGVKSDPTNYRPISLVNTCAKILTSLMTFRLNAWCEKLGKISEFQAAYRKGVGCEDHVFTLNAILQNHLKNKKNVMYALFIDLSKAFDSISHVKLWKKLAAIGLSTKFIGIIQCLHKNAKAKIRTLHGESEYFNIQKGVLQGECLSAKLFTLFINDIVKVLHDSNVPSLKIASKDIHMLMYADDIVVLSTNVFDLQSKVDLIISYFKENDLNVNLKTKIVMFKYGRERKVKPKVYWMDTEIEFVNMYTYLGVNFYSNLNTSSVCAHFLKKAKSGENHVFNVMWRCNMKTLDSRMKLYYTLVKSLLTYCSSIWGIDHIDKLEVFQNNFLRRLLNLPKKSPNWYGRLETNSHSIEVDFVKNVLHFWKRLFCRPRNSLIYECYLQLRNQCDNPNMKFNWYRSFRSLLINWNCTDILEIESTAEESNYLCVKSRISALIDQIRTHSQQLDIIKMQSSSSIPMFQQIKTHCKTEQYLNYIISWNDVCIVAQLRNNLSRLCQTNLRDLLFFFNQTHDNLCEKCYDFEIENCYHVMFHCKRYKVLRDTFLNKYILPDCPANYLQFFVNMNIDKIKDTCKYVRSMLAIRNKI